ncbi:dTDP-4-dehydrorhamnose reductase [Tateyamaria sp. SN6-1]|uniref:dTDP-4-dehydrorhamnose reductase n=1 Tax=Tateyamaria sp. SN6-1 TaxID=3092148 RepID=UPI0039F55D12
MILVIGRTGQVAIELARLDPEVQCVGRETVDLTQPDRLAAFLADTPAKAIINAAAYTAVDAAEAEPAVAHAVNAVAVGVMAQHAARVDIPFVHISTDYVFSGGGTVPWHETDPVAPQNVYGQSKLSGEAQVTEAGGVHAILRTSWVFSAHGSNFLKTMLRLSESRDHLTIVADQIGGPTPARAIAQACLMLARSVTRHTSGIYHFSGAPDASWADFARDIFKAAGREVAIENIPTSAYPTPATRPLNSRLNCDKIKTTFDIARPDWRAATQDIVRQLT